MSRVGFGMSGLLSGDRGAAGFSELLLLLPLLVFCRPAPAEEITALEQKALVEAVDRVSPAVVRIETIGGLERVNKVLFGLGPTTGLIVDSSGYIVSSAFNFVNKPASILVRLPDGTRKPAKLVARDHNCQLALLKIEADHPLPVAEMAPQSEMRVGQWCVAVGRTFEESRPNMAMGILSAVGRVWGKALQTDARVSPNNYGGPLVDVRGRVMGVLVPLSPQSADEVAGIEWYDSGIGFAIPLETIEKILPRLRKGEELYSGVAGISLQAKNIYTGDTVIGSCRLNSPAAKHFKAGDRVVEIGGRKVARAAEVKQEIARHYGGDKLHVVVMRGEKRIEADLELVAKMEAFQHGFLGILPLRDGDDAGVTVRYVYPGSPAAEANIEPGDVIASAAGEAVVDPGELRMAISSIEPGMSLDLEVRHKDQTRKLSLKLAPLPSDLPPPTLPPARSKSGLGQGQKPPVGWIERSVPEFKNKAWAYVPERYDSSVPHGVVVWLHGPDKPDEKVLLPQWKPLCDAADLVLVAPQAGSSSGWQLQEANYVEKLIGQVKADYAVDPARVVVFGREKGASLAFMCARSRELVRAVAAIDTESFSSQAEIDPAHRLAIYLAASENSTRVALVKFMLGVLKGAKIPVTQKDLGKDGRDLTPAELAELVRWIDMLDRI